MFPYDFGFVPSTKAEDGDPLDVLVLTDEALFPGCLVECSLIGILKAEQKEERHTNRNDRFKVNTSFLAHHSGDERSGSSPYRFCGSERCVSRRALISTIRAVSTVEIQ